MKNIIKTLKFETYKTLKNKFLMLVSLTFLVLFLVIIIMPAYTHPMSNDSMYSDREQEMLFYENQRAQYESFLKFFNEGEALPEGVLVDSNLEEFYKQEYEYYDYLIRTNTLRIDYALSTSARRGTYVMNYVMNILGYILPVVSMLAAFFFLTSEYSGGTAKNLLAATVSRKSIFFGKVLFLCIINLFVLVVASAYPMIAGLSDSSAKLLIYGKNGWHALPAFAYLFFPKIVSIFASMIFCTALSVFLGQFFKKRVWGLIAPLLVCGILELVYAIIESAVGVEVFFMPLSFMRYADIGDIIEAFAAFSTGWLWLMLAAIAVTAFSAVCTVMGAKKIEKQDY